MQLFIVAIFLCGWYNFTKTEQPERNNDTSEGIRMKNTMKYRDYIGSVEFSEAKKCFFGNVLGIRKNISYEGEDVRSLIHNFHEAVDDYLTDCNKAEAEPEKAYKGTFNVRVPENLHREAALYGLNNNMSLNSVVENALQNMVEKNFYHPASMVQEDTRDFYYKESKKDIEKERMKKYFEDESRSYDCVIRRDLTVTEEEIKELCSQMKQVAIANAKTEAQKAAVKDLTKNQLLGWGLLAEDEDGCIHPTNGYIFLQGKDQFLSQIQCGMFKGKSRAVFVDKREYTGPLWQQVEDAFQFALRNIRLGARIEGIYRQDIYELPPDSIRELIINAVMNCSFLQNSHIQVAVYDDRLEITSPGGLLPGVTIERMKEGYSKIRNRALAHAFLYMNMIEAWGSGIPKLMESMREYGLEEPEFIDMGIGLRINLYRRDIN